jgi:four helix bundle protein
MANGAQGGWRGTQQQSGGRSYPRRDGERGESRDGDGSGAPRKGPPQSHRDLIAWQKALELAVLVHGFIRRVPEDERPLLGAQLLAAAVAVPAQIAVAKSGDYNEFAGALARVFGKLAELDTLLILSVEVGYLKSADLSQSDELIGAVKGITGRLLQRLRDGPKDREQGARSDRRG